MPAFILAEVLIIAAVGLTFCVTYNTVRLIQAFYPLALGWVLFKVCGIEEDNTRDIILNLLSAVTPSALKVSATDSFIVLCERERIITGQ